MDDFKVINEEHTIESRKYSDRYEIHRFTFDREITADEFQEFLMESDLPMTPTKETARWYESYIEVSGAGCKWEYKAVTPFLD